MSDQIGCRNRTDVAPQSAHNRLEGIADKSRCAGSGQYDVGFGSKVLVHECTNLRLGG